MAVETILEAFRAQLATIDGIRAAYYPAPAQAPQATPCVVLRPDPGIIELAALEVWTHRLVVFVLVAAKGQAATEFATATPYLQAVVAKTRGAATLGGLGCFTADATYDVGTVSFSGVEYVGATLIFGFEEKTEVTITP